MYERETTCGRVRGYADDGVLCWRGIPYAAPPAGELRFRRAAACEPWQGVKDCRAFGNKPIQFLGYSSGSAREDEDCLTLNVMRPDTDEKDLPVFVWIYGGGFAFGESDDPGYDGRAFARSGFVFVSFNYRLGPLGWYPLGLLDSNAFDTNCGLSDQIAALGWIRENIAAFGGDPNNVTIAGESAGGSSVCYLLASPAAKGLFGKAIVQSGIPEFLFTRETGELQMDMFLRFMGMERREVSRLRDMPAAAMKRAAKRLFTACPNQYPGMGQPGPTIDDLAPSLAADAAERGETAGVKLLIGLNRDEGTLFHFFRWFIRSWRQAEQMRDAGVSADEFARLKELYSGMRRRRQFSAMATDRLFLTGSVRLADMQSRFADVYAYRFDYAPALMRAVGLGATHSVEVAPIFGTFGVGSKIGLPWMASSARIKRKFHDMLHSAWTAFARTGNPDCAALGCAWDKYDAARRTLLISEAPRVTDDPWRESFDVWNGIKIYT